MSADKRAILHIPHTEMLALKNIRAWMNAFADNRAARVMPTEIVLPAVGLGGPSFQSEVHPYPNYLEPPKEASGKYSRPFNLFPDWVQECRNIDHTMPIWAIINPVYAFLGGEYTRLIDQHGITLDNNMCITNQVVQQMTDTFIDELIDLGVDGFVFDLTDIYPQSGSNLLKFGTQNTCFCPYCLDALEAEGFHEGVDVFVGETNPFRLVLRVDEDGTDNIPVNVDWPTSHLVKMSLTRGFIKEDNDKAQHDAALLLSYIQARARVTAQSVRRLGQHARDHQKRVAVILSESILDLTTMTTMQHLQRYEAANEYWMPEVERKYVLQQQVLVCAYMWAKATYAINAFFEVFEQADTILSLHGVDEFLGRLMARSKRLIGNNLNSGNVFAVKKAEEFKGFVGVPFGQKVHADLVNLLSQRATGQILPPQVLDAFRITNPTGSIDR